jgi:NAD(P)-dependent dehydrogenase (short-subunit alcohol dehydrogenase family)
MSLSTDGVNTSYTNHRRLRCSKVACSPWRYISDEAYVKRLVEDTVTKFEKLDVLISNAGMAIFGPVARTATKDWRKVTGTDLDSVYFASREALPHLLKRRVRSSISRLRRI